jgi:hypothetical protein
MLSAHLEFFMLALPEIDRWDPTSFHRVGLERFTSTSCVTSFQSCCKMCIYRPGFTYGSCMMVLHAFLSCSLGILEQNVSGTMDGTMCTNSMACSFAWLRSLRYSFLRTPEGYCLCYRSQWRPGLATANAEWIWDDLYDTWNFPATQAITVRTCNVVHWGSRWTLWEFYLIVRRP